jgi:hypothetical protein
MNILRDKNRVIIELPDEEKAENVLWLLTNLIPSSETTSPPSSTFPPIRHNEAQLTAIERSASEVRELRRRRDYRENQNEPGMPFRTQKRLQ